MELYLRLRIRRQHDQGRLYNLRRRVCNSSTNNNDSPWLMSMPQDGNCRQALWDHRPLRLDHTQQQDHG